QTLQIRRHLDGKRSLATRMVNIPVGKPMELRVFVDGDIVEVFLDERYSLVARAHHFPKSGAAGIGYFTNAGAFVVENVSIHSLIDIYDGAEPPPHDFSREPDPDRPGGSVNFPYPHANGYADPHEVFEIDGSLTLSCWFRAPEIMGK